MDSAAEAQARGEAYSVLVATAMAAIGVEEEGPGDLPPDLYEIFEGEDFTGSCDAAPRILDWCRDNDLPTTGNRPLGATASGGTRSEAVKVEAPAPVEQVQRVGDQQQWQGREHQSQPETGDHRPDGQGENEHQ